MRFYVASGSLNGGNNMTTTATVRADFATRLYDQLAKAQAGTDLFLSPFSIQVALAMCAAGARGETRRVLADLIGAPASVAEQNRLYAAWLRSVNAPGAHHVHLATANALWVQQGYRLDPNYRKVAAEFYDGACNELDFRALPEQAVKTINGWVDSRTQGKIKELITGQHIGPDTRLILTNAIYFKGNWASQFDRSQTRDEDWHGTGRVRKVPMMHQTRGYLFHEAGDFQALDLPYQGEQLSMLVVLPRKKDGLAALEQAWAAGPLYQQVVSSLAHEESVDVTLPRFQVESEFQLQPVLSALGAGLAFGPGADFSGIGAEPLQISEVIHKALIEVNEEGTEATGATGVVMTKGALFTGEPKSFRADHPFLFVIRDRKSNAVLFCGRVAA
jgi:serpin B